MDELPEYTIPIVLSFLDIKSTHKSACVSKQWEMYTRERIKLIKNQAAQKRKQMPKEEQDRIDEDFLDAANHGNLENVLVLLENGANINAAYKSEAGFEGATALMVAAWRDFLQIIQALLRLEANVNSVDSDGWTPLIWAAAGESLSVAQELLDNGAQVDAEANGMSTALCATIESAETNTHLEVVEMLLDNGANIDAADEAGRTPLILAAYHDHQSILKILIKRGASLDIRNCDGSTALGVAEECKKYGCAEILKKAGDLKSPHKEKLNMCTCGVGNAEKVSRL